MSEPKHMVFVSYPFWGHLRPMMAIAFSLLPLHPGLHITVILSASFFDLVSVEVSRYELSEDILGRLHFIHYGDKTRSYMVQPMDVFKLAIEAVENFKSCFPSILRAEPIVDSVTGFAVTPITIPPSIVVGDYALAAEVLPLLTDVEAKAENQRKSKFLVCSPMQSSFVDFYVFDRVDHPLAKFVLDDITKGIDGHQAVEKHIDGNDTVIHLAAHSPIFDALISRSKEKRTQFAKTDGIIYYTSPYLGRGSQAIWSPSDKPQYLVGPLLPPHQPASIEGDVSIWTYLDAQPSKSVAYISFGSLFFHITESQAKLLIEALAKRSGNTLFITGNSSPDMRALLERTIENTLGAKERIRLETWTDQLAVLRHPAVAWFLTHAGQGAINESISAGVPMILWPCGVDQPFIANQLSQVEKVGIELIQIRSGVAIGKPTYRGPTVLGTEEAISGELDEAFVTMDGPEAGCFRARVAKIRDEFEKDRRKGGRAWQGLMDIGQL